MIERLPGEYPPFETRAEAHDTVDKNKRYQQITEVLKRFPKLSAKQIAVIMCKMGMIPTTERNFTAPRLTEMTQKGLVEPVGRTTCEYTGKSVTVYALCDKDG